MLLLVRDVFPGREDRHAGCGDRLGGTGLAGLLTEGKPFLDPVLPAQETGKRQYPQWVLGILGREGTVACFGFLEQVVAFKEFGRRACLIGVLGREFLE